MRPVPGRPVRPAPSREAERLRRSFWWWGRLASALAAAWLAWQLLLITRSVVSALLAIVLMTIFAAVVALLLAPLVNLLVGRAHLPRTLAALLCLLALLGAVIGVAVLIANPLVAEAKHLTAALPALQAKVNAVHTWLAHQGINLGNLDIRRIAAQLLGSSEGGAFSGFLITAITGVFSVLVDLVIVLVAAFWFLRDGDHLRRLATESLPMRWRSNVDFALTAFGVVVGGYVRGQVVLAVIIGFLAGLGSAIVGVPYPLVVAVAAAIFELIPLIGPFAGGAVAALLALTVNVTLLIEVIGVFVVIHLLEGYLIAPRLQGRYVRLHPVVTFLSLFAGIEVAGFLGALVAVPLASLAAVLVQAILGDVRAARPEIFERRPSPPVVRERERQRRELLRRYRIRYADLLRTLVRRLRLRSLAEVAAAGTRRLGLHRLAGAARGLGRRLRRLG
jgi:predicted PurR-regulated permease PerM